MKKSDFVFLEQIQDAVVILLDDGVLARAHFGNIHRRAFHGNTVLSEVMQRVVVMLRRLQQRLRRNTTDVSTCSTRCRLARCVLPFVDTRHFKAQLCRANRRDVAARATTDNYNVKLIHICTCSRSEGSLCPRVRKLSKAWARGAHRTGG